MTTLPAAIQATLSKLALLIAEERFEDLETDVLEIKPIPADTASWRERYRTANAFLNTRGGVLLLGFKEVQNAGRKYWQFTGYNPSAEPNLKELALVFTDRDGRKLDLKEAFPPPQLVPFGKGFAAIVYVDELPADKKYVFLEGRAFKRLLTGDHQLTKSELDAQDEYRQELWNARELQPLDGTTLADISLDQLNDYIQHLNRPVKVETMKADLESARRFLERKQFVSADGRVTTLGMLVCGLHPADRLGFRAHVHAYIDMGASRNPGLVAEDKQDLIGNVLSVMEGSLSYIYRSIRVGVSITGGGASAPEYPEEVLRETVNNALAHRDYSIDKQAFITIRPGQSIVIRNPGRFRPHLLIESGENEIPVHRILPEAKARNPKLADVLRVYRKWEGKGIGMATLVNLCLEDRIDIPRYRLYTEEVALELSPGPLMNEAIRRHLDAYDRYLASRLGAAPTREQLLVLAYLIKSEWANEQQRYTILLTPDNNHFEQLLALERAKLIVKHPRSTATQAIYVADRALVRRNFREEVATLFGEAASGLDATSMAVLELFWRLEEYSSQTTFTAKRAALHLWEGPEDIAGFDRHYRAIRRIFNGLEKAEFIRRQTGKGAGFRLHRARGEAAG